MLSGRLDFNLVIWLVFIFPVRLLLFLFYATLLPEVRITINYKNYIPLKLLVEYSVAAQKYDFY